MKALSKATLVYNTSSSTDAGIVMNQSLSLASRNGPFPGAAGDETML